MSTMTFNLRYDMPIVIETPLGLIRVTKGRRKRAIFQMPPGMRAYIGEEYAMKHAKFVTMNDSGDVFPDFKMLVPITDDQGRLLGVGRPNVHKIETKQDGVSDAPLRIMRVTKEVAHGT